MTIRARTRSVRKALLPVVAAALASAVLTTGTADAATAQPRSAVRCGSKWCFFVSGLGLKVDTVTINRPNHGRFSGYPFIEVSPPHARTYFIWHSKVTNVKQVSAQLQKSFPNNTELCGGVAPTKAGLDYPGVGCIVVHD